MSTAFFHPNRDDRTAGTRTRGAARGGRAAAAVSLLPLLALALACLDGAAIYAAGQLLRLFGAGH